jgi:transcriptional regulator with XRE-family HTH domain
MSDLGQLLKKARTNKGYTLEEIQNVTKIRKRYLEAIEEGNYKVLPGNFYVRAFIKSYSEAVGLEADEVIRLYRSDHSAVQDEPVIEPIRRRTKPSKNNTEKMSRWASALLLLAFPLLIFGIIYYYANLNEKENQVDDPLALTDQVSATDETNTDQLNTSPPVQEPEPELEPPAPEPELSLVKSSGGVDYYLLSNSALLEVEVEVIGDKCWLAIRNDNATGEFVNQNLTLNAGDKQLWSFEGGAFFHFGRSNAVKVKVNGLEINMGDLSNPRKVQIDLEQTAVL